MDYKELTVGTLLEDEYGYIYDIREVKPKIASCWVEKIQQFSDDYHTIFRGVMKFSEFDNFEIIMRGVDRR